MPHIKRQLAGVYLTASYSSDYFFRDRAEAHFSLGEKKNYNTVLVSLGLLAHNP
jgi:hypothetical protein